MNFRGSKITAALLAGGTLLTGAGVGSALAATANPSATAPSSMQGTQTQQARNHAPNPAVKAAVLKLLGTTDAQMKAARAAGTTLTQIAANNNVTKADLVSTIAGALKASKPANAPTLTDEQLTARATKIADRVPGQKRDGQRGDRNNATRTAVRAAIASTLSMTADQLKAAHKAGTTPAQLASQKGVAKADLVSAVSDALKANKPANAPTLTAAQLTERATAIVDGVHGPGHRR